MFFANLSLQAQHLSSTNLGDLCLLFKQQVSPQREIVRGSLHLYISSFTCVT